MRLLLFFLALFISVSLHAGMIKVINNSDKPIFVTAKKFGCTGICYTEHPGFNVTKNKTHLCCLEKSEGLSSKSTSQIISGTATIFEGIAYDPFNPLTNKPPRFHSVQQFPVPGWYIKPDKFEEEDFSRNNYTFYVYQQDSDTEWVNEEVDQGMILSFPEDFT